MGVLMQITHFRFLRATSDADYPNDQFHPRSNTLEEFSKHTCVTKSKLAIY